jgi:hypothetical protein
MLRSTANTQTIVILSLLFSAYCLAPPLILTFGLLGAGLLRRWRWARRVAIVVSVLNAMFNIPIGTLFGVAVIVLLSHPEAKAAFSATPLSPKPIVS